MCPAGLQQNEAALNHDGRYGLPPVLTAEDAAQFLRVNVKTIYEAIQRNGLPAKRLGKRRLVILRDALLNWLASQGPAAPSKE